MSRLPVMRDLRGCLPPEERRCTHVHWRTGQRCEAWTVVVPREGYTVDRCSAHERMLPPAREAPREPRPHWRVWVAPGVYSPPLRRSEAAGMPWGEIVRMAMREAA